MTEVILDPVTGQGERERIRASLDFLWLELTNRCNLQCVHCYTESGPQTGDRDLLTVDDYLSVMSQARELGCRQMQFIGGEPQLSPHFQRLLEASKEMGFEFVEVFSNLTRLSDETVRFARSAGIHFATSVYSDEPEAHQAITRSRTSHARTIGNLRRLVENDIVTRAAVIQIDQTSAEVERTKRFLADLGVRHVRSSYVRSFGRGEELVPRPTQMSELCGHCWAGRLCVAPDGDAYPCVMARQWPVGNVLDLPLADIVLGGALREIRAAIHETVWQPRVAAGRAMDGHSAEGKPGKGDEGSYPDQGEQVPADCPQSCEPDIGCLQSCEPDGCLQSCSPNCDPRDGCLPIGIVIVGPVVVEEAEEEPAPDDCPQSCEPDAGCPQSCEPSCDPAGDCPPTDDIAVLPTETDS
jgi:MoaA/NifB/PqqE/SkfB family radical SAM enzyme